MTDSTSLGQHLDDFIDGLVESGRYENRDAVLKKGLELLERREKEQSDLDAALARGLAQAKAGLGRPIEEVAAELKAKYTAMARQQRHKEAR